MAILDMEWCPWCQKNAGIYEEKRKVTTGGIKEKIIIRRCSICHQEIEQKCGTQEIEENEEEKDEEGIFSSKRGEVF